MSSKLVDDGNEAPSSSHHLALFFFLLFFWIIVAFLFGEHKKMIKKKMLIVCWPPFFPTSFFVVKKSTTMGRSPRPLRTIALQLLLPYAHQQWQPWRGQGTPPLSSCVVTNGIKGQLAKSSSFLWCQQWCSSLSPPINPTKERQKGKKRREREKRGALVRKKHRPPFVDIYIFP